MPHSHWLIALLTAAAFGCAEDGSTAAAPDASPAPDAAPLDVGLADAAPDQGPPPPSDVEVAADWLTGDFNSRAQAMEDRRYFDVHLWARQIWSDREDGVWMYVQQSRDDDEDGAYEAPYRQRVYWVHAADDGAVVSTVYRIEGERVFADPWRDLTVLDVLADMDLVPAPGCDVTLRRQGDAFTGGTQGTGCRLSFGGYATSSVTLTADGLQSLDLLYDDAGNIVNGLTPDSAPYTFEKLENFPVE